MSKFNSTIQTLTDGLIFCKNYLKNNPNASDQDKAIKHQQIAEHEKAIQLLLQANEASKKQEECSLGGVGESKLWYVEFKQKGSIHVMSTTSDTSSRDAIERDLILRDYEVVNIRRIYFR